jgi:hypothetical protein
MNVTHKIDPNQREDLRAVYLHIHGSAIVDTIPELATDLKLKRTYVKELIGVLETHADRDGNPFVHVNLPAGEGSNDTPHDYYSTTHTVDDHTNEDAQHWFDEHWPVLDPQIVKSVQDLQPAAERPTRDKNPANLPECRCGCGEICNRGRNYRPGHDARHAGDIARQIANHDPDGDTRNVWLNKLPTDALRIKADNMADGLLRKAAAKTHATRSKMEKQGKSVDEIEKVQFVSGKVKIGRNSFDAEQNMTSGAVSYTNSKGVQVANERVRKSFVANDEA